LLQHGPVGPFGPNDPNWRHSELAKKSGTGDFDSAHVYLARWAKIVAEEGEASRRREAEARRATHRAAMTVEESEVGGFEVWDLLPHIERPDATRMRDNPLTDSAWLSLFDGEGRPNTTFAQMKALVFRQGFGKGKQKAVSGTHWDQLGPRAECWSFLLGAQLWDMKQSQAERRQLWNTRAEEYWAIKTKNFNKIVTPVQNTSLGGLDEGEEKDVTFWREQRHRVHVDCMRVDRKLPFFSDTDVLVVVDGDDAQGRPVNAHAQRLEEILLSFVVWDQALDQQDTPASATGRQPLGGYVQGMSDLCAPLYAICNGDEAKTFWLLVGLMKRARRNFYTDQSGMKTQLSNLQHLVSIMDASLHAHLDKTDSLNLFFCFRWLLVYFKREFAYDDILVLWEAIWAAEPEYDEQRLMAGDISSPHDETLSRHFEVFIALAMLEQQRDVVVKYLHHFDEILQYMNGLAGQFDVDSLLAEAQVYCLMLRTLVSQQSAQEKDERATGKETAEKVDPILSTVTLNDELRDLVAVK
jgi:hypothetical protein